MGLARFLAWALFSLMLSVASAQAEKRVALVIGNGAYARVARLPNPTRDANAMAALFRQAGFDVVEPRLDLDLASMRRALREFSALVRDADVAVVYYAGHGMETNGTNYLIPVDAVLEHDIDVEDETISLDRVSQLIEPAKRLRLIILDACRDNPFTPGIKRTMASRTIGRGLGRVEVVTADTMIAFAAKAGSTAGDGTGSNSPYTTGLLKHLATPGLDVRLALGRVRDDVVASTGGRQEPFVYGSLGGAEIALRPGPAFARPDPVTPRTPDPCQAAEAHWKSAEEIGTLAMFEDHVARFPGCAFATLAKARIEALQKLAVVVPRVPPGPCGAGAQTVSFTSRSAATLSQNEECALKPKDMFKECDVCPEMIVVPAGRFLMGSSANEPERDTNEEPQHHVTFGRNFAVGRFAVTFQEWDACVADRGCNGHKPSDQGWGRGRRPVINVSWVDAKAYVAWLSRKTGKSYRLLSEAEREYVTRAGKTPPFWWGQTINPEQANYNGNVVYNKGAKGQNRRRTMPVDSFEPNPFGLYQVHGNVWEWTEDCWHDGYDGAPLDGTAWAATDCVLRVLRGGSWINSAGVLRAASRIASTTGDRDNRGGFRVARTLTP